MVGCGLKLSDFCEIEWRRQKTFHGFKKKPDVSKPTTATPVVELRPFTQKEWSRGISLPGPDDTNLANRSDDGGILNTSQILKSNVSPARPTPRVHVINLPAQILSKANRLHPQVDQKLCSHQPHLGFITLGERTKSTLEEIRSGTSLTKPFSCLKQALSEDDVEKIQDIRLSGSKMRENIEKRRLKYLDPWSDAHVKPTYDVNTSRTKFFNSVDSSQQYRESMKAMYGTLDIASSLPSLTIRHPSSRSAKSRRSSKAKSANQKLGWRRVGGIKSSFQIMNEKGPPANIEKCLTTELEINLGKMRRNRNNGFNSSSSTPRKFQQISYRSCPTAGEIHLQWGLTLNSQRSHRVMEEPDANPKQPSRPTTETKTECRDSGIQSPVGTDDDSVDSTPTHPLSAPNIQEGKPQQATELQEGTKPHETQLLQNTELSTNANAAESNVPSDGEGMKLPVLNGRGISSSERFGSESLPGGLSSDVTGARKQLEPTGSEFVEGCSSEQELSTLASTEKSVLSNTESMSASKDDVQLPEINPSTASVV